MDYAAQIELAKILGQRFVEMRDQLAAARDGEQNPTKRAMLDVVNEHRLVGFRVAAKAVVTDASAVKIFERFERG